MRFFLTVGTDSFAIAQSLGVFVAMTTNFFLNNTLTYHDRSLRGKGLVLGLLSFYVVCSIGSVANVAVADFLHDHLLQAELASLVGAFMGALWNYAATSLTTWRTK